MCLKAWYQLINVIPIVIAIAGPVAGDVSKPKTAKGNFISQPIQYSGP